MKEFFQASIFILGWILGVWSPISAVVALAAPGPESAQAGPPSPVPDRAPTSQRKKSIDFEDNVLEGMNHNPLDSLEHVYNSGGSADGHLYRKRLHYKKEIPSTAQEAGFLP